LPDVIEPVGCESGVLGNHRRGIGYRRKQAGFYSGSIGTEFFCPSYQELNLCLHHT